METTSWLPSIDQQGAELRPNQLALLIPLIQNQQLVDL